MSDFTEIHAYALVAAIIFLLRLPRDGAKNAGIAAALWPVLAMFLLAMWVLIMVALLIDCSPGDTDD